MPYRNTREILASLQVQAGKTRISGVSLSARAYLTRLVAEQSPQSVVVLCPNEDQAQEFLSDLESFAQAKNETRLPPYFFPSWDPSPYSPISLSLHTRYQRISVLGSLLHSGKHPQIIVSTLPATQQKTPLPETFFQSMFELKKGSTALSREALTENLLLAGYLRSEMAEDPGTFAVRGEIIDLISPVKFPFSKSSHFNHLPYPIRVEFFDDEIEQIREFDPETQRTLPDQRQIDSIYVPPCREVLFNPKTLSQLREQIKNHADQMGMKRALRDPLLKTLHEGVYPEMSEFWSGFAYAETGTFWNYLPSNTVLIWNDESLCQESWQAHLAHEKELALENEKNERIVPPLDSFFELNAQTMDGHFPSQVYFDSFEDPSVWKEESPTQHRIWIEKNPSSTSDKKSVLDEAETKLRKWLSEKFQIFIFANTESQIERIQFLLEERKLPLGNIHFTVGTLSSGFTWSSEGLVFLTEVDLLGIQPTVHRTKQSKKSAENWSNLQSFNQLKSGDAIVHIDHGIGRYRGLVRLNLSGAENDFLLMEYAQGDKLYVPIYRLNVIQKYAGSNENIPLDRLGSAQFQKSKDTVKEAVKELAVDLVQLYAQRKIQTGIQFSPADAQYREFESAFPYQETPDQLKAIQDILSDLESGRMMDRLVCGDVGYGKTEVAIRAAFKAASEGKQVAVLVPTTLLAFQHEQSFKERLKNYPILVESLSRFKNQKQQKIILEALSQGKIDIIIGTHRLLSSDVKFQDLGLIIVDEEHRFGVEHKEKLKALKLNSHMLTLTATPIPRTLHMALSGLRDMSLIATPPVNRMPIKTFVSPLDDQVIKKAIEFELSRGGQVFYLHNRVASIDKTAESIQKLVPSAQIVICHGQLAETELEKRMFDFYHQRGNVLLCTTLIESGLDLPSANTLIVERADMLGLAQLYQIRGRVGRGEKRAYAYLFMPPRMKSNQEESPQISHGATRRLEVIQRFVELGSGFSIASHDLEIRGGGNLLGAQQSGHIASVGFELYTELLEEAIQEIQGTIPEESKLEPEMKVPFPAFLSEKYIPDVHLRLSLYRQFSAARTSKEVQNLEEELQDRFGTIPSEAINFLWLIRIKQLLKAEGIQSLTVGPERISLLPATHTSFDPVRLIALLSAYPDKYQLTPDSKLVIAMKVNDTKSLFFALEKLIENFKAVQT